MKKSVKIGVISVALAAVLIATFSLSFFGNDFIGFSPLEYPIQGLDVSMKPAAIYSHPFDGGRVNLLTQDGRFMIYNPISNQWIDRTDSQVEQGLPENFIPTTAFSYKFPNSNDGRIQAWDAQRNTYVYNPNTKQWLYRTGLYDSYNLPTNFIPQKGTYNVKLREITPVPNPNDPKSSQKKLVANELVSMWDSQGRKYDFDFKVNKWVQDGFQSYLPNYSPDAVYYHPGLIKLEMWYQEELYENNLTGEYSVVPSSEIFGLPESFEIVDGFYDDVNDLAVLWMEDYRLFISEDGRHWEEIRFPVDETCTDSDGGLNYYVNSFSDDGDSLINDGCIEGGDHDGWLREAICEGERATWSDYDCPNGCEDGACIYSNESFNEHYILSFHVSDSNETRIRNEITGELFEGYASGDQFNIGTASFFIEEVKNNLTDESVFVKSLQDETHLFKMNEDYTHFIIERGGVDSEDYLFLFNYIDQSTIDWHLLSFDTYNDLNDNQNKTNIKNEITGELFEGYASGEIFDIGSASLIIEQINYNLADESVFLDISQFNFMFPINEDYPTYSDDLESFFPSSNDSVEVRGDSGYYQEELLWVFKTNQ